MPVDLHRRWHLRTTSSTGCGLQLAAETKLEIMNSKRQQQCIHVINESVHGVRLHTKALLRLERTMNLLCHQREGRGGGGEGGGEGRGGDGREGESPQSFWRYFF